MAGVRGTAGVPTRPRMTGGTASRVPVRGGVTGDGGEGSRPRPVPLRSLEKSGPTPHTPTAVPVPARGTTARPTPTVVPVPGGAVVPRTPETVPPAVRPRGGDRPTPVPPTVVHRTPGVREPAAVPERPTTRRAPEPVRAEVGGSSFPKNRGGADVPTVGVRTPGRSVPASVTTVERPVPVPPVTIGTSGWDYDPPDLYEWSAPLTESDVR
jgi:hypothetical protein